MVVLIVVRGWKRLCFPPMARARAVHLMAEFRANGARCWIVKGGA